MIEILTGVFSGVLCALISCSLGYAQSRGKRFDSWILVVGAVFGVFWTALDANAYFTWQAWVLTVIVLVLFEYGGKAIWRKMDVQVNGDRERFFVYALNIGAAVYIVLFLVALFLWFLPFAFSEKFMIYEWQYGMLVFRWFASSVAQIEREAFSAFIVLGFPLMVVFSYYALTSVMSGGISNE
jgi:hypothetical protein